MAVSQELVAKFKAETSQFERKVQGVQRELRNTTSAVQKASQETSRFERTSASASSAIANNYKAIGLAVGAAAVAVAAFSVKVGSEMQAAQKRIEGMLGSSEDAAKVMSNLRAVGQETGASVQSLADGFGKLAVFVDNGTISLEESLEISKGLSSATIALGASTEQLNQVLFGFSQAMGSGTVRAEEFNQVTEPLPGIINRMEEAAGLATGELRRMINEGEVTSEMFKELLIPALKSFEGQAKQMVETFQAQSGILSNTLSDVGSDIYDFLEEPLISATKAANEFLQSFLSIERAGTQTLKNRLSDTVSELERINKLQGMGAAIFADTDSLRKEIGEIQYEIARREGNLISFKTGKPVSEEIEKQQTIAQKFQAARGTGRSGGSKNKRTRTARASKEKPVHEQMAGLGIDSEFELLATKDHFVDDFKTGASEIHSEIDLMDTAFSQMSTSMLSSFMAMSQGSKVSFKDMARSLINDMQAVIVKALVMRAISGIAGSFGGAPCGNASNGACDRSANVYYS